MPADRPEAKFEQPLSVGQNPSLAASLRKESEVRYFGSLVRPKCIAAKLALFDHLVGGGQQRLRNHQAERLGGLEIYDQLDLC